MIKKNEITFEHSRCEANNRESFLCDVIKVPVYWILKLTVLRELTAVPLRFRRGVPHFVFDDKPKTHICFSL